MQSLNACLRSRAPLGRQVSGLIFARGHGVRLFLVLEGGGVYEFWQHAVHGFRGASGLDRETALERVNLESLGGNLVEAILLDPAEQAEADRLIASAPFSRLLREAVVRPESLRRVADSMRSQHQDPFTAYQWALDRLPPDLRSLAPGPEILC